MRRGTRVDHNRFCLTEDWQLVRDARGRAVGHHVTYELTLDDGRILRTRISRPVDKTTYGPALWKSILREQLDVTEAEFWRCVKDKSLPPRGRVDSEPSEAAIPAGLAYQLIHVARIPEDEVRGLTREQAVAAMAAYWTRSDRG